MFDPVYVVTLDRSPERWAWMRDSVLPVIGPSKVVRWPAIDGELLDAAALARLRREGWLAPDLKRFLGAGPEAEIACAMSHVGVLRAIADSGHGSALVLEDDVALAPPADRWSARFGAARAELPDDWDMFYLYRCLDFRHRTRSVGPHIVRPWLPLGGAAYAVTPLGARKLLEAILPLLPPDRPGFRPPGGPRRPGAGLRRQPVAHRARPFRLHHPIEPRPRPLHGRGRQRPS